MNDQLTSIARQRGKVVAMLVALGFVQGMVHPETAGTVWQAMGLAVGAMAGMEAWASRTIAKGDPE